MIKKKKELCFSPPLKGLGIKELVKTLIVMLTMSKKN